MANFPIAVVMRSLRRNFFNEVSGRAAETEPLFCATPVPGRREKIDLQVAGRATVTAVDQNRLTAGRQAAFQTARPAWHLTRGVHWKTNMH